MNSLKQYNMNKHKVVTGMLQKKYNNCMRLRVLLFCFHISLGKFLLPAIVVILLLGSSCREDSRESFTGEGTLIQYDYKPDVVIPLSPFFDTVEFVFLGGIGEFSGEFRKVVVTGEHIYATCKKNKTGVFMFTREGEYIRKIGILGRGPGEFVVLSDFAVDEDNDRVIIYDVATRSLVVYDREEGGFTERINTDILAREFELLPSGNYLFYTDEVNTSPTGGEYDAGLLLLDGKGQYVSTVYKSDPLKLKAAANPENYFFRASRNELWFCDTAEGKLIQLRDGQVVGEVVFETLLPGQVGSNQGSTGLGSGIILFGVTSDVLFCALASPKEGGHLVVYDFLTGNAMSGDGLADDISSITNPPGFSRDGSAGLIMGQPIPENPIEVFADQRALTREYGLTMDEKPEYNFIFEVDQGSYSGIIKIFTRKQSRPSEDCTKR